MLSNALKKHSKFIFTGNFRVIKAFSKANFKKKKKKIFYNYMDQLLDVLWDFDDL